jgi:hypothetical protein
MLSFGQSRGLRAQLLVCVTLVLSSCSGRHLPGPLAQITRAQVASFDHVFVVVEENENYADVIGNAHIPPSTIASFLLREELALDRLGSGI